MRFLGNLQEVRQEFRIQGFGVLGLVLAQGPFQGAGFWDESSMCLDVHRL